MSASPGDVIRNVFLYSLPMGSERSRMGMRLCTFLSTFLSSALLPLLCFQPQALLMLWEPLRTKNMNTTSGNLCTRQLLPGCYCRHIFLTKLIFFIVSIAAWRWNPSQLCVVHSSSSTMFPLLGFIFSTSSCVQQERLHLRVPKPKSFLVLNEQKVWNQFSERNPGPMSCSFTSQSFKKQRCQTYLIAVWCKLNFNTSSFHTWNMNYKWTKKYIYILFQYPKNIWKITHAQNHQTS